MVYSHTWLVILTRWTQKPVISKVITPLIEVIKPQLAIFQVSKKGVITNWLRGLFLVGTSQELGGPLSPGVAFDFWVQSI